jgi:hypothetical protein
MEAQILNRHFGHNQDKIFLILMRKYFTPLLIFKRAFLLIPIAGFIFNAGYCQKEFVNNIRAALSNYNSQYLQEKIYLHSDKSFYVSGEIVWFKIYTLAAGPDSLLDISKVAYVEIIGKDQKPVLQAKISLKQGLGSGSFYLPFSLASGNYKLRAYTNFMKNYSADYFFEKDITIVNTTKRLGLKPRTDSADYDIQFFPEGGNLVNGLESKVAFRMVDRSGKGVDFPGVIINKHKDTVTRFRPLKFGIGHFFLTPVDSSQYKAIIYTTGGKSMIMDLPKIYSSGYVMRLRDSTDNRLVITVSSTNETDNNLNVLLVHSKGRTGMVQFQETANNTAVFVIHKDSLEEGISSFTLFDGRRHPVCERLYFKRPSPQLVIQVNPDKPDYQSRKKIHIDILSADGSGNSIASNMSVAVYKEDSLQPAEESNILTYLWLTSNLQGSIESPAYYLKAKDPVVDEATDNLMLTHGWRRFRWEDITTNKPPAFEFPPEYEGHIIVGKVIDKSSGQPVEDVATYLSIPAIHYLFSSAVSNAQGIVKFDMKDFYSTNGIALQTADPKDSNYAIDILSPFAEKFSTEKFPEFDAGPALAKILSDYSLHTQVQNIYSEPDLQRLDNFTAKDSTAFYGKPDQAFNLDDYTRFNTMEEVMREYVAYILVQKRDNHFHYKVLNYPYRTFFDDDPLVLLDGVPISDITKIIAFDPLKVRKIEVMNRKYFLGPLVADGIVSYTSYNGDLAGFQLDPNVIVIKYDGLQLQREFYSPVYETKDQTESRLPDFRDLLYWSPNLNTDKSGKTALSFYSSDLKGRYLGIIQGISADGKAGAQQFSFTVGN